MTNKMTTSGRAELGERTAPAGRPASRSEVSDSDSLPGRSANSALKPCLGAGSREAQSGGGKGLVLPPASRRMGTDRPR